MYNITNVWKTHSVIFLPQISQIRLFLFENLGYNDPTAATWAPDNSMNIFPYAIKQANLPL